jgi:hypothetical protein
MSSRFARLLVLHCSMILAACSGGADSPCTRDSDCPSNFCRADGTCGPTGVDGGTSDSPTDGPAGTCTPNHDGAISVGELPLVAGKMANFRIATNATFDTTGVANGDGTRTWHLDVQLSGDTDHSLALAASTGAWWAASFPTATYAASLSSTSDLLGVFHVDAAAVTLLGVVSPDAGTFRTELSYDPPAKILALPFQAGSTWSSTSTVSGTAQGVISAYSEHYTALVDQVGTMTTPYGDFPVLRVATDLERTAGLATLSTTRTFAWVAECFGSVANATSQDFESASEFNDPAEVRRLTP